MKNSNNSTPLPIPSDHAEHRHALPADLVSIADRFDALGASDRAAAPFGLESRLASLVQHASAIPAPAADIAADQADTLARAERHAAAGSLEESVFRASRAAITAARSRRPIQPVLQLVGGGGGAPPAHRSRPTIVVRRAWIGVAAALGITGIIWLATRSPVTPQSPIAVDTNAASASTQELAAQLKSDLEDLFDASSTSGTAMLDTSDSELDASWLNEWIPEEAL